MKITTDDFLLPYLSLRVNEFSQIIDYVVFVRALKDVLFSSKQVFLSLRTKVGLTANDLNSRIGRTDYIDNHLMTNNVTLVKFKIKKYLLRHFKRIS